MDAIAALHTRNSSPKLAAPAPTGEACEAIFQAALRAPDHACLRPWRFQVYEGEAREQLGVTVAEAMRRADPALEQARYDKLCAAPLRAPMVVVAAAHIQPHPKVPEVEQLLSAGAAVTNMLNAAHALGYAAIWRTGDAAFEREVMDALGFAANEQIVGFVYLGTRAGAAKPLKPLAVADYFALK